MASEPKLRPCPFCKSEAEYSFGQHVHDVNCSNERCLIRPHVGIFAAEKYSLDRKSGNNFVRGTKADVIRIWNEQPTGE
jgi:hypothetical protein